jgi:hypothetical protein
MMAAAHTAARAASRRKAAGRPCRGIVAAGVAAALVLAPAAGRAAEPVLLSSGAAAPAVFLRQVADEAPARPELPPEVQQSLGCAIAGSAGTAAAVFAGGENLVNIIAGGVVMPQNRAVLYIGLVGVVFASFCAIGQALTPLYLYSVATPEPATPDAVRPAARTVRATAPAPLLRTGLTAHGPLASMLAAPAGAER